MFATRHMKQKNKKLKRHWVGAGRPITTLRRQSSVVEEGLWRSLAILVSVDEPSNPVNGNLLSFFTATIKHARMCWGSFIIKESRPINIVQFWSFSLPFFDLCRVFENIGDAYDGIFSEDPDFMCALIPIRIWTISYIFWGNRVIANICWFVSLLMVSVWRNCEFFAKNFYRQNQVFRG